MPLSDWLRLILLSLLWGGSFLFVGIAAPHLPPMTISLVRVGLAALVLAAALPVLGIALPRGMAVWGALAVMGLINNVLPFTLFAYAQGQIGSGLASILNATTPLWGAALAHVATRDDRLTGARSLGIVTGFAGVAVMMGGQGASGTLGAQLACLLAALCYAIASLWGRRFRGLGLAPLSTTFGQVSSAALILVGPVLLVDQPWALPLPPAQVPLALVALAVVSTAGAYGLYFGLIARAGAVNASLVTFLIPVSAIALGVLVLGEAVTLRQTAGLALIALGLAVLDGRAWRWLAARLP